MLAPAGAVDVEVDLELLLLGGVLVGKVIIEIISVAKEQLATVSSRTRWGVPPACEVIKPECYCIQPPCVRLCIVGTKVKIVIRIFCCHASESHSV